MYFCIFFAQIVGFSGSDLYANYASCHRSPVSPSQLWCRALICLYPPLKKLRDPLAAGTTEAEGHPMAAATKQRGQPPRKRRRRRRKQKAQQMKPPIKQRRSGSWKPVPKGLNSQLKKKSNWRWLSGPTGLVPPVAGRMSVRAKKLMNSFMDNFSEGLVSEADRWRKQRRGSFIGTTELRAAAEKIVRRRGGRFPSLVPRSTP